MRSKDRQATSPAGKVFPGIGLALAIAGLLLTLSSLMSSAGRTYADPPAPTATATPGTATISLHNNTAETGTDCPDAINDYWHFVLAPNDGTFKFAVLHLNIGGTVSTFNVPADVVLNSGQYDNLFVKVPAGKSLSDLQLSGSFAEYTGVGTPQQFNLSHVCDGNGTPTPTPTNTPTNVPTNTPTNVPTNTPTNVPTNTPTNVPTNTPTNTPVPTDTPTATNTPQTIIILTPTNTPVPPTATATLVAQVAAATAVPSPVSQVGGVSVLPRAGDGGQRGPRTPLLALGLGLMAAGSVVFAASRRRARSAGEV